MARRTALPTFASVAKRFVLAQELMAKTRQGKPRTATKGKNRILAERVGDAVKDWRRFASSGECRASSPSRCGYRDAALTVLVGLLSGTPPQCHSECHSLSRVCSRPAALSAVGSSGGSFLGATTTTK